MAVSLFLTADRMEQVYGWLESNSGAQTQLWGWEQDRRTALLAYSNGPGDDFGWSNWASSARPDPSELCAFFDRFELVLESDAAAKLNATMLGAFTVTENTAFG